MLTFTDKEREKAMNIGEHFYCSRCLSEIGDEGICPECGYDPESPADKSALEEGTVLGNMRFHVGAVRERLKIGYVYGAYDYEERKPACIFEYFPKFRRDLSVMKYQAVRYMLMNFAAMTSRDGR